MNILGPKNLANFFRIISTSSTAVFCTSLRRLSTSRSAPEKFSSSLAASLKRALDLSITLIRFSFSSLVLFDFSSLLSRGAGISSPVSWEPQSEIGPIPKPSLTTSPWLLPCNVVPWTSPIINWPLWKRLREASKIDYLLAVQIKNRSQFC